VELTQRDYDERKARVDKGEGDDEDARLVKHYEANGFTTEGEAPQPAGGGTTDGGKADDNLTVTRGSGKRSGGAR
jgi:hypothetical protein